MKQLPKKEEHAVSGGAQAPDRVVEVLDVPIDPMPGPTYPKFPWPNPLTHPEK